MNTLTQEKAAQGFAAIGSEHRLEVYLTLVRAGDKGMSVGQIQQSTDIPASTLAHHLRFLTAAGLLTQSRQGRTTLNHANFDRMDQLAQYITAQCCIDASVQKVG